MFFKGGTSVSVPAGKDVLLNINMDHHGEQQIVLKRLKGFIFKHIIFDNNYPDINAFLERGVNERALLRAREKIT